MAGAYSSQFEQQLRTKSYSRVNCHQSFLNCVAPGSEASAEATTQFAITTKAQFKQLIDVFYIATFALKA